MCPRVGQVVQHASMIFSRSTSRGSLTDGPCCLRSLYKITSEVLHDLVSSISQSDVSNVTRRGQIAGDAHLPVASATIQSSFQNKASQVMHLRVPYLIQDLVHVSANKKDDPLTSFVLSRFHKSQVPTTGNSGAN